MEDRLIYIPIVCGIILVIYMFYAMTTYSFKKSDNILNSTMKNTCYCSCECKEENNE